MGEINDVSKGLTLAIIGSGKMGTAILSGLLADRLTNCPTSSVPSTLPTSIPPALPITNYIASVYSPSSAARLQKIFHAQLFPSQQLSPDPSSPEPLPPSQHPHQDHVQHPPRLTILQNNNLPAFRAALVILLACKPSLAGPILQAPGVRAALAGKFLISVLAGEGVAPGRLAEMVYGGVKEEEEMGKEGEGEEGKGEEKADGEWKWGGKRRCYIIRAAPNLAASVRASTTVLETPPSMPPTLVSLATSIFSLIGTVHYIPSPSPSIPTSLIPSPTPLFPTASTLSGASPAFLALALDGLLDGAAASGLSRATALTILADTLSGLAELLKAGRHPAVIREEVASPGGTTIRGLLVLERAAVRGAFAGAVEGAVGRAVGRGEF